MDSDMMAEITAMIDQHRQDDHTGLAPGEARELVEEHYSMVDKLDLIICEIAGEPDKLTGERGVGLTSTVDDLKQSVEELSHRGNGGGGFSVRRSDQVKIAIWSSITTIIVGVLSIITAVVYSVLR